MFNCYTSKVTRFKEIHLVHEGLLDTNASNDKNLFQKLYDGSIIAELTESNILKHDCNSIDNIKIASFFDMAINCLLSPNKIKLKSKKLCISSTKNIFKDCSLFIRAKIISRNLEEYKYLCELTDDNNILLSEIGTVQPIL